MTARNLMTELQLLISEYGEESLDNVHLFVDVNNEPLYLDGIIMYPRLEDKSKLLNIEFIAL